MPGAARRLPGRRRVRGQGREPLPGLRRNPGQNADRGPGPRLSFAVITVDLEPALYRALSAWAGSLAVTLDVPKVSQADAVRAMIRAVAIDGVGSDAVTQILAAMQ